MVFLFASPQTSIARDLDGQPSLANAAQTSMASPAAKPSPRL